MRPSLQALRSVDPAQVALPNGTEVTVSVSRTKGERVIKKGAVGRVRSSDDEGVLVHIAGVGELRYQRNELRPRRAGQWEYALRRHLAWESLRDNVVLQTVVGSRAWGLANKDSDVDLRGVFVLPFSWTTALVDPPLDLVREDGSANFWEIEKALRQGIRADPNTLETLFLEGAEACDEMGEWILQERDALVSRQIYGSFGRYALSQLRRLQQGRRLFAHRALLLEWLRADRTMTLDQAAEELAREAEVQAQGGRDAVLHAKQYIKQLYSSLFDQGLIEERNFASLARFARAEDAEAELVAQMPSELRPKNAYNLLRLLQTATHWLQTGEPVFAFEGDIRDELLAIKEQRVPMENVIERAEELAGKLEEVRHNSPLPENPDVGRADQLLRKVRSEAARRWYDEVSGVFGRAAATLPLAEWED